MKNRKKPMIQECIIVSENESEDLTSNEIYKKQSKLITIYNNGFNRYNQKFQQICVVDKPTPKKVNTVPRPKMKINYPLINDDIVGLGLRNPNNLFTLYAPYYISKEELHTRVDLKKMTPQQVYDIFLKEGEFFFYVMFKAVNSSTKSLKWIKNLWGIPDKCQKLLIFQYIRNLNALTCLAGMKNYKMGEKKKTLKNFVMKHRPHLLEEFNKIEASKKCGEEDTKQQTINIINNITITNNFTKNKNIRCGEVLARGVFDVGGLREMQNRNIFANSSKSAKIKKNVKKSVKKTTVKKSKSTKNKKAKSKAKKKGNKRIPKPKKKKTANKKNEEVVKDLKFEHFPQTFEPSISYKTSPDLTKSSMYFNSNALVEANLREQNQKVLYDRNKKKAPLHQCQTLLRQIPKVYLVNLNREILDKLSLAKKKADLINPTCPSNQSISLVPEKNQNSWRTKTKEQVFYLPSHSVKLPLQSYMSQLVKASPQLIYFDPEISPVCPLVERSVSYFSFFDSTIVFLEEAKMLIDMQSSNFTTHEFNTFLDDIRDRIKGCFEYYRKNNLFMQI
jgi:hypothetical protein